MNLLTSRSTTWIVTSLPVALSHARDDHFILGQGFLVFLIQHHLRLFAKYDLVLLVVIRTDCLLLKVEHNDRPFVLNPFVELDDLVRVVLDSFDQIGVGALSSAFAFAISISSIPASSSATIGFEPNSPPVMEPVGVVRDQPVVGLFLLEFDLGKRDLDLFVLSTPMPYSPASSSSSSSTGGSSLEIGTITFLLENGPDFAQ